MLNLIQQLRSLENNLELLEKKTGISRERLNSITEGQAEPSMTEVRALSKVLKLSIDFLLGENEEFSEIKVLFRSSTPKEDTFKIDRISHIIGNIVALIGNNKSISPLFTSISSFDSNKAINAVALAYKFRELFFKNDVISPLISLPRILVEELQCVLSVSDLGKDTDGASAVIDSIPFIFVSPRFEGRMLYTIAHELGHILAHLSENQNFGAIDKEITYLKNNRVHEESFANIFAGSLLLPQRGVGETLKYIRAQNRSQGPIGDIEIIYLSRVYGVSFEVAAKRCEELELLPEGGAISLYEYLKKVHGGPEQRAKQLSLPERAKIDFPNIPAYIVHAALDKINQGELSLGKASEILRMPITKIVNLNASNN
ncbi:XRE family transcriptional regulator [Xanthocytophaga agilis]|uniref:XRE family transcriptional regulator n=1 Tax=Xanthocytophaga agilis TaxID=3048010 RepID=A0AAE3UEJ5_9BACT|nr:XRE family transcriptional regulator [Xanthocytophaga agilis]MDJ1500327.1 XRE family transcriptional regulator [Xanthocytophaga agilis]